MKSPAVAELLIATKRSAAEIRDCRMATLVQVSHSKKGEGGTVKAQRSPLCAVRIRVAHA